MEATYLHNPAHIPHLREDEIHFTFVDRASTAVDLHDPPLISGKDFAKTAVDEGHIYISISYVVNGKFCEMQREMTQGLHEALHRISRSVTKEFDPPKRDRVKKNKNKPLGQSMPFSSTAIVHQPYITFHDEVLPTDSLTWTGLQNDMFLHIGTLKCFKICINPPCITFIDIYPKAVCTVYCPITVTVDMQNSEDFEVLWYVERNPKSGNFSYRSSEKVYYPTKDTIGCKVKVYCKAKRFSDNAQEGRSFVQSIAQPIQSLPSHQILSQTLQCRHYFNYSSRPSQIHPRNPSSLRVMSYNILSECYCQRQSAKEFMYNYCQSKYLDTEYRMQRILFEIIALDANIIALQECDYKVFFKYFLPILGSLGYFGHYTTKVSLVNEGCALFIRSHNSSNGLDFQLESLVDLPYKNVLRDAIYLQPFYDLRPDLRDIIGGKVGTVGQLAICKLPR